MSLNEQAKIELFALNKNRETFSSQGALDWVVEFPRSIGELSPSNFYLQVESITFVNFIPNIQQGINDTFSYEYTNELGVTTRHSLIFAQGVYDINDIINTLSAEFVNRNANIELTYDFRQLKLSLFVPANTTITLVRPLATFINNDTFSFIDANDRLLEMLGWTFVRNNSFSIVGGNSGYTWTPDNPTRLDGTMILYLNSSAKVPSYTTNQRGHRPIASIPVTSGYGSICHSPATIQGTFCIHTIDIINGIRFFVTDEWGVEISKFCPSTMPFHVRFSLLPPF